MLVVGEVVEKYYCSLRIQECRFEFHTSYGNDQRIHFSNNQSLIESCGVRLTCLDCNRPDLNSVA